MNKKLEFIALGYLLLLAGVRFLPGLAITAARGFLLILSVLLSAA